MTFTPNVSGYYGTHLAPLIVAINKTKGPILELGTGFFSTPFLHYTATLGKRKLESYDNVNSWIKFFKVYEYQNEYHKLISVKDWDKIDIERPWDVVLVDHSPDERRIIEVKRLASYAKYLIIHDSNGRFDVVYHYTRVYPLFKYKTDWTQEDRHSTVLSNFIDLKNFWK